MLIGEVGNYRLRICWIDGGETGGVGGEPASLGGRVLAEIGVVQTGLGIALVAGKFVRCGAGVGRHELSEGIIVQPIRAARYFRGKGRGTKESSSLPRSLARKRTMLVNGLGSGPSRITT